MLPRLLASGVSPERLHDAVCRLRIELVMTAHPTEIMRRTLQHKYNLIATALAGLDRPDLTRDERETLLETMRREITGAWRTEEVRRERPSPLDEVRSAMAVFEETLWDAMPRFCRSLDRTLRRVTGRGLPLEAAPIRFGSWIGGDRDGNPSVTPGKSRGMRCLMARWTALSLYSEEIEQLRFELSMQDRARRSCGARAARPTNRIAPCCATLQQRLEATRRASRAELTPDAAPQPPRRAAPRRRRRFRGAAAAVRSVAPRHRATTIIAEAGSPTSCAASRRSACRWCGSTSARKRR